MRESRAVSGAGLAAALLRAWGCTSWRTGGDPPRPLLGPLARWPGPLSPRRRDGRSQRSSVPAVPPPGTACCGLCGLLRPLACCVRDRLAQFRGRRSPLAAGFQVFTLVCFAFHQRSSATCAVRIMIIFLCFWMCVCRVSVVPLTELLRP